MRDAPSAHDRTHRRDDTVPSGVQRILGRDLADRLRSCRSDRSRSSGIGAPAAALSRCAASARPAVGDETATTQARSMSAARASFGQRVQVEHRVKQRARAGPARRASDRRCRRCRRCGRSSASARFTASRKSGSSRRTHQRVRLEREIAVEHDELRRDRRCAARSETARCDRRHSRRPCPESSNARPAGAVVRPGRAPALALIDGQLALERRLRRRSRDHCHALAAEIREPCRASASTVVSTLPPSTKIGRLKSTRS